MVGNYNADFYVINGMVLETRKRREHLSTDDLRKNKALLENFAKGNAEYLEQQNGKHYFYRSLKGWMFKQPVPNFLVLLL